MKNKGEVDKFFLTIILLLSGIGAIIFVSASFGILAGNRETFNSILVSQLVLGLGGGSILCYLTSKIHYKKWRSHSLALFILGVIFCGLVFVPGLGAEYNGAKRWLSLGPLSFQPAELLKIVAVIYLAAWLSYSTKKGHKFIYSVIPLFAVLLVSASVLLMQPDTKSFILISGATLAMFLVSGVNWKYIVSIGVICILFLGMVLVFRPYTLERVETFLNPSLDEQGSGYQLKQSLIAIGAGGAFGRGLGQSVQKFTYLPEPHGDSIFAVLGEEFGFLGTTVIVLLYMAMGLRGLKIATASPDMFGRLLVVGIVILFVGQSFLNIFSMIGLFPLTGVPLIFISHGGTALLFSFVAVGIILNVSRYSALSNNQ